MPAKTKPCLFRPTNISLKKTLLCYSKFRKGLDQGTQKNEPVCQFTNQLQANISVTLNAKLATSHCARCLHSSNAADRNSFFSLGMNFISCYITCHVCKEQSWSSTDCVAQNSLCHGRTKTASQPIPMFTEYRNRRSWRQELFYPFL